MAVYISPFEATSQALKNLIETEVLFKNSEEAEDSVQVELNFDVPNSDFVAGIGSYPVVNLYLYRMQENQEIRYSENYPTLVNTRSDQHSVGRRPRFVDLFYAVTVWIRGQRDAAMTEQNLMSRVLQGIGKHEFLPHEYLQKTGFDTEPYGVPQRFFTEDPTRAQHEFWSSLGSSPKPMLPLMLTVPVHLHEAIETPFVDSLQRNYGVMDSSAESNNQTSVVLSGSVNYTDGSATKNLIVIMQLISLPSIVLEAEVNANSGYRFYNVKAGAYRLWVEFRKGRERQMLTDETVISIETTADGSEVPFEYDITIV